MGDDELSELTPPDLVRERTVFRSPWMSVNEEVWQRDGASSTWYYQVHPGCVLVLPFTPDGEVLLLRAWRIPVRKWCLEAPAGRCESGEPLEATARRELGEEVGGTAAALHLLGSVHTSNGSSNEQTHIFVAHGTRTGARSPDPDELLEPVTIPFAQALEAASYGEISDGSTALALFWAWHRGLLPEGALP